MAGGVGGLGATVVIGIVAGMVVPADGLISAGVECAVDYCCSYSFGQNRDYWSRRRGRSTT